MKIHKKSFFILVVYPTIFLSEVFVIKVICYLLCVSTSDEYPDLS
jgi:hypothetical protein